MTSHWYVIHTYAGFEGRVRTGIVERANQLGMGEAVGQVLVPTEDVVEFKEGSDVPRRGNFFLVMSSWKLLDRSMMRW